MTSCGQRHAGRNSLAPAWVVGEGNWEGFFFLGGWGGGERGYMQSQINSWARGIMKSLTGWVVTWFLLGYTVRMFEYTVRTF